MTQHIPVMLNEVVEAMNPQANETYVDGTFGGGGYSKAFMDKANCYVIGTDRDPDAVARGRTLQANYPRLSVVHSRFSDLATNLGETKKGKINGFVFDLGVSSFQIDTPERGFSFRFDGPLDMRMGHDGPSAADLVNTCTIDHLTTLIRTLGDEHYARKIALRIGDVRAQEKITRTLQLADLIRSVVPRSKDGLDPATRTFQALRIAVNSELEELTAALMTAEQFLAPEGRLVVVSFHSLEDRIVKHFMVERSGGTPNPSRFGLPGPRKAEPSFNLPQKKTVKPTDAEIRNNPRASSARLRCAIRTASDPFPATESLNHA